MTSAGLEEDFAFLRIAVFGSMALIDLLADAGTGSALELPRGLRARVPGAPWIGAFLSLPRIVRILALSLFRLSAIAAALGLATSLSTVVACALGVIILGVPSVFGGVRAFHHLWWFGVLLAATPCGREISLDALINGEQAESFPWEWARLAVLLVFGLIYLFPGIWKLRVGGFVWGDTLPATVESLWFDKGGVPAWLAPMLSWGRVWRIAGLSAIAFELAFVCLVFIAPVVAACLGLLFHAANGVLVRIPFLHLALCYVFLVSNAEPVTELEPLPSSGQAISLVCVSTILVMGIVAAGVSGRRWWPFGVYPTFSAPPGTWISTLRYETGGYTVGIRQMLTEMLGGRRALTLTAAIAAEPTAESLQALRKLVSDRVAHCPSDLPWRVVRERRRRDSPDEIVSEEVIFDTGRAPARATRP